MRQFKDEMKKIGKQHFLVLPILFLLIFGGITSACRHAALSASQPDTAEHALKVSDKEPVKACEEMPPDSFDNVYGAVKSDLVFHFYTNRGFKLFWINNESLSPKAVEMIEFVKVSRYYGLLPQDYHLPEIESLIKAANCTSLLRLDALLTDAFLVMATHLRAGKLKSHKPDSLQLSLLADVASEVSVRCQLESQEPAASGYSLLKSALFNILDTVNVTHRELLLKGVISESIPVQKQVQQIEINLERWRWENDFLKGNYVWINIPSYTVSVFENDSMVMQSKVIVGTPETPTPILSSAIECFIVYPYWHVPRKIAVEEYLPVIKTDLSFIPLNNFEVLDRRGNILGYDTLDWQNFSADYFPVSLRQRDGPENSLGIIKFSFDNPYAVFLHDTNAKRLFQRQKRALSHGCIRMEKAVAFAHYLAGKYTKKYTPEAIDRYIALKKKHTVELITPLPIYVRYFTCDYDGTSLQHYEDIYAHDQLLRSRFYRSSGPSL